MELIFLGTSAAIPSKSRSLSSVALKYRSDIALFDCGAQNLQQKFVDANLKLNNPLFIFISHLHADHVIGISGLLFRFNLIDRTAPVKIFGPRNLYLYFFMQRLTLGLKVNYPFSVYEIDDEDKELIEYQGLETVDPKNKHNIKNDTIFEKNRYIVRYARVKHSVPTFAYSFQEKPRFGKFHPERALKLGIPESRLWKTLQSGKSITYKGKTIDPLKEGIVEPKRPGRKITFSGDTAPCESLIELGKGSDILIHEATFSKKLADTAEERKHSTSIDAAMDAKNMNAKKLYLTHISSRYEKDASKLLSEARSIFPNTYLAEDFLKEKIK
ncbi:MAG: ribonuclease Z [Promethearchaeota archaeon]|nr:MAG: ribonuclease Z [Candidatus Lokiarchaeota archaeon]